MKQAFTPSISHLFQSVVVRPEPVQAAFWSATPGLAAAG